MTPYRNETESLRAERDRLAEELKELRKDQRAARGWWEVPTATGMVLIAGGLLSLLILAFPHSAQRTAPASACMDQAVFLQPGQTVTCSPGFPMERVGDIVICRCSR